MSLRPVVIEQFPGLDMRADPGDARAAIDLSNVLVEPGRVRTRPGSTLLTSMAARVDYLATYPGAATQNLMVYSATGTGTLTILNTSGTAVGTTTTTSVNVRTASSVNIGVSAGGSSLFYFAAAGLSVIHKWDGSAWSTVPGPAGVAGPVLGISPTDNRLVVCGVPGFGSKVSFSDPGAPDTFGANNFVLLGPADGEMIQATAVFNNQLFIFKQTKFYVFYGNSVDSTGNPIFNYRVVDTGIGVQTPLSNAFPASSSVKATDRGVYFISRRGIYRTTGGTPVKISTALDPFFMAAAASPFSTQGSYSTVAPTTGVPSLTAVGGKIYCSLPTAATTGIMFVYDEDTGTWVSWGLWPGGAVTGFQRTSSALDAQGLCFAPVTGTAILRVDESATTDNGTAIASRYRLPFETYGTPGEKRIRETIVEGTGTPTVQWSDDWGALTTGSAVTLGTSPAVAVGRQRLAQRGRAFSLQLGAASGAWAVNRVQVNVGEGIRGAEVTV